MKLEKTPRSEVIVQIFRHEPELRLSYHAVVSSQSKFYNHTPRSIYTHS